MNKSIAVLGLGKYGKSLADTLYEMGVDILVADNSRETIQEYSKKAAVAVVADLANEEEVRELGISNMDIVVVAMGCDLEASIMCVMMAKEMGVPMVVAKASTDRMAAILTRVGADRIINPEKEMGMRTARILNSSSFLEFFSVDDNFCLIKMKPKQKWIGRNLLDLDLRKKYNMNVVAVEGTDGAWGFVDPSRSFEEGMNMLVAVEQKDVKRLK